MKYFDEKTVFNVDEKEKRTLDTLCLEDENVMMSYDGVKLMFFLSCQQEPNVGFFGYLFSDIDGDVLNYHILEKTSDEIEKFKNSEIDLKSFMRTAHSKRRFREEISANGVKVYSLDDDDLNKTLSYLKDNLYYRKIC